MKYELTNVTTKDGTEVPTITIKVLPETKDGKQYVEAAGADFKFKRQVKQDATGSYINLSTLLDDDKPLRKFYLELPQKEVETPPAQTEGFKVGDFVQYGMNTLEIVGKQGVHTWLVKNSGGYGTSVIPIKTLATYGKKVSK